MLDIARRLPADYKPPNRHIVSGPLLETLYNENWKENMSSLLKGSREFGVSVFGDGATIVKVPMINVLAASPNNSEATLDIIDCSDHCAAGEFMRQAYTYHVNFLTAFLSVIISISQGRRKTHPTLLE